MIDQRENVLRHASTSVSNFYLFTDTSKQTH